MDFDLQTSIAQLHGLGPKLQEKLNHLGIYTVFDVLLHQPLHYQDRTCLRSITSVNIGESVLIEARIMHAQQHAGRSHILTVSISDGARPLQLTFFHYNQQQLQSFTVGRLIRCFASVKLGIAGLEMVHPEYELDPPAWQPPAQPTLTPVYPSSKGLSQTLWRKVVGQSLHILQQQPLAVLFPASLETWRDESIDLNTIFQFLHGPDAQTDTRQLEQGLHPYQQLLVYEELLAHQLSLLRIRLTGQQHTAVELSLKNPLQEALQKQLSFSLTRAQRKVLDDVEVDLKQKKPMLRLLQGDVGSGKTIVAAMVACAAIDSAYQVAILVPTEVLAEQHVETFKQWLEPLGVNVQCLMGKHSLSQKKQVLEALTTQDEAAKIQLLIGTHAIYQEDVVFENLALVIIDEQHRFGVHQRLKLREKGSHYLQQDQAPERERTTEPLLRAPHQLVMTATPIPRTLAMTAYANLDCSIIDELPPGRQPIQTLVLEQHRRQEVITRIQALCATGRQVYWVCTLVNESENLNCQSAEKTANMLQAALPELKVGLIHGQLNSQKKTDVMAAFTQADVHILVATTVIEVGVNVPNATLMVIENPERLGLAQIHQLRGRVGRGSEQSYCILMYQKPLTDNALQRLKVLRESQDGFVIAEMDLQLRGAGEILGSKQTGLSRYKIANLERDHAMLHVVHQHAQDIIQACVLQPNGEIEKNVDQWVQRWINFTQPYTQA